MIFKKKKNLSRLVTYSHASTGEEDCRNRWGQQGARQCPSVI